MNPRPVLVAARDQDGEHEYCGRAERNPREHKNLPPSLPPTTRPGRVNGRHDATEAPARQGEEHQPGQQVAHRPKHLVDAAQLELDQ